VSLSVIIPTVQVGALLDRCLRALAEQSHLPDEVIVVIAHPDSPGVDEGEWPWPLRIRRCTRQTHYGAAVNLGLSMASGAGLVILNDDTRPRPGFLAALHAAWSHHGPALYQPRIHLLASPRRLDNVGHGLFFDGFNWARGRDAEDGVEFDTEGTVGAISGAAFLLPRAVFDVLGGFDTSLEAFGEDVDLSLRAVRMGIPLRYVPDARIEHALGASYGRYSARKLYLIERNRVRVAVRSLPASAVLTLPLWTGLRWATMASATVAGRGWGVSVGGAARAAAVGGALASVVHLPDAMRKRRADAGGWQRGEVSMWRHLITERARLRDLLRHHEPEADR
jgi:GT2 family glycosyltransferase